ncbi:hypothetical protein KVR01_010941 [Diaporthe batatas]|uniref:uncharacterized protein n=1 Tax=Diaporthe batatas TaxID=748121 RepID=UPI001D03B49C|nr:uncharacterized protein KVR01_010941 [Diaporthe batatas]KAG8159280.1 hypothetical protein KVR01_010941 [Diaporthe batatas]
MAMYNYVSDTIDLARRQADRVVSPDDRQKAYDSVLAFAQQQPLLFSFVVAQLLLSLIPILLFASFVLGTVALAISTAVIFCLFWVGVASILLGSTLFVTFGLAALGWLWLVGAYLAASFVYGLLTGSSDGADQAARFKMEDNWAKVSTKRMATDDAQNSVVKKEPIDDGVKLGGEQLGEMEISASSG